MFPYSRQDINEKDIESVLNVLRSDLITQGQIIKKFEHAVAEKVNARYSFALNSATSALHVSCMALGLTKDDILWTVPNSFVASANCGLYCGATVNFVDINPCSFNISIDSLKAKLKIAKIQNCLPKILVTVDFSGQPVEQEEIRILSKEYDFYIIEDASHAIGAQRNNNMVGCNKFSDITVFSFHPVKIITSAEGGMALTESKEIAHKIDLLRSHGITKNLADYEKKINEHWYYEQQYLGYNYRLSEIHAALGLSQLNRLDEFVNYRNNVAKIYNNLLKDLPIQLPHIEVENYSSFHLYVIRLKLDKIKKCYNEIFNHLRDSGIGVNLHYIPIHLQPIYKKKGFKLGDFPEAEKYSCEAISLPIYFGLKEEDQIYIYKILKELLL